MANDILLAFVKSHQIFGVVVLAVKSLNSIDEYLMLVFSKQLDERFSPIPEYLSLVGYIISHLW